MLPWNHWFHFGGDEGEKENGEEREPQGRLGEVGGRHYSGLIFMICFLSPLWFDLLNLPMYLLIKKKKNLPLYLSEFVLAQSCVRKADTSKHVRCCMHLGPRSLSWWSVQQGNRSIFLELCFAIWCFCSVCFPDFGYTIWGCKEKSHFCSSGTSLCGKHSINMHCLSQSW